MEISEGTPVLPGQVEAIRVELSSLTPEALITTDVHRPFGGSSWLIT